MKAIGFTRSLPITESGSLINIEIPKPEVLGHDLLVKVLGCSVNPVDYKVRQMGGTNETPRILGWDGVGIVEAVGEKVSLFKPGDEVFYAGDISRQGSNAEYQLVDERITGPKPETLSIPEAAAMPLTSLTAWEGLFDRMNIKEGEGAGQNILIIGAAGGVGSIAIQLARKLTKLNVIATASKDESVNWCRKMGAHEVINHYNLCEEFKSLGVGFADWIFCLNDPQGHWEAMGELIRPQGDICSIVDSPNVNITDFKAKSVRFSWEFMFTRSRFKTPDRIKQHEILSRISKLLDEGQIKSTLTRTLKGLSAANLKEGHTKMEEGRFIGKLGIEY